MIIVLARHLSCTKCITISKSYWFCRYKFSRAEHKCNFRMLVFNPFSPTLSDCGKNDVYQSVQHHTGLTHPSLVFWHSGTLALSPAHPSAWMSKN